MGKFEDGVPQNGLPGRVDAALSFLAHCRWVENDDVKSRELLPAEAAVRNAALDVLRNYLSGEMDFGDPTPILRNPDTDEPQEPVPVSA